MDPDDTRGTMSRPLRPVPWRVAVRWTGLGLVLAVVASTAAMQDGRRGTRDDPGIGIAVAVVVGLVVLVCILTAGNAIARVATDHRGTHLDGRRLAGSAWIPWDAVREVHVIRTGPWNHRRWVAVVVMATDWPWPARAIGLTGTMDGKRQPGLWLPLSGKRPVGRLAEEVERYAPGRWRGTYRLPLNGRGRLRRPLVWSSPTSP